MTTQHSGADSDFLSSYIIPVPCGVINSTDVVSPLMQRCMEDSPQGFGSVEVKPLPAIVLAGLGSGFGYRLFIAQMVHDSAGTSRGKLSVSEGGRFRMHMCHP